MRTKKIITAVAVVFVVAVSLAWVFLHGSAKDAVTYRFAAVERGDVEASVSATGALSAVTTVQVGTQVSGQVAAIFVDYNARVKAGQLLARIDATLQQQSVSEAQAGLARSDADVEQAQREYDRNKQLFDRKVITDKEMTAAKYSLQVATANLRSAQISLDRAHRNLAYTQIYAPVDGIVVERNVDVGQTVAASLATPQLFLIAKDMSEMQILAAVDESDIGSIHQGQEAHFTVQAYPNRTFTGVVRQVRLQSATQENVVSYTVVVGVNNADGKLLPGMTATVDFVTGSATNALTVPNAALRFRPASPGVGVGVGAGAGAGVRAGAFKAGAGAKRARVSKLFVLGADKKLVPVPVTAGVSDGTRTQVTGNGLKEGMQVIIGSTGGEANTSAAGATSPFQPTQPAQTRGPRPGGF